MSSPPRPRLEIPGRPRPWVMAHRGASDHAPENSLASFGLAIDHGADLIETDLWVTRDGVIVCHHDPTLHRMTGDPRRVDQTDLDDIRGLELSAKAGYGGERVPTLTQLVAQTPANVPVILELKDPTFAQPERAAALAADLGDRVQMGRAGIISADLRLLRAVKKYVPGLVAGHIAMTNPLGNTDCEMLGPYWPLLRINPLYIRRAHRRGQRVCPLDPDLHRRLPRYFEANVDAVLTNDPAETRRRLEALRRGLRSAQSAAS